MRPECKNVTGGGWLHLRDHTDHMHPRTQQVARWCPVSSSQRIIPANRRRKGDCRPLHLLRARLRRRHRQGKGHGIRGFPK
jgi:hypothetical protein